jgi:hypothetical protein
LPSEAAEPDIEHIVDDLKREPGGTRVGHRVPALRRRPAPACRPELYRRADQRRFSLDAWL